MFLFYLIESVKRGLEAGPATEGRDSLSRRATRRLESWGQLGTCTAGCVCRRGEGCGSWETVLGTRSAVRG